MASPRFETGPGALTPLEEIMEVAEDLEGKRDTATSDSNKQAKLAFEERRDTNRLTSDKSGQRTTSEKSASSPSSASGNVITEFPY